MKPFAIITLFLVCVSCGTSAKPAAQKHYPLTGKVVSVNAKEQTAAIDAAAIKNFMEAMTMDYPIQSKAEFATLHPGDRISATVDVSDDGSYALSHIHVVSAAPKK